MKLATSEDMRRIDGLALSDHGLTFEGLMERAGQAVAKALERHWNPAQRRKVVVLCGKGNNGGDGLVVARLLRKKKVKVEVFLAGNPEALEGAAALQWEKAKKAKVSLRAIPVEGDLAAFREALGSSQVLVDALFGTGLSRPVEGLSRALLSAAKASAIPVLAVDVPSGMSADNGQDMGEALPARVTVTFGLAKTGFFTPSGKALTGKVEIAPIGFPEELLAAGFLTHQWTQASEVASFLPHPGDFIHKGDRGKLLIIAGSTGLTGAAALCALAAQRIGAGLVTVACPKSLNTILEVKLTEPMTVPLPELEGGVLSPEALPALRSLAEGMDAVVIGPGLGRHPGTGELVRELAAGSPLPMVMDADALYLLGGEGEVLRQAKAPRVVTPHPGEAARLLKTSPLEVERDRAKVAGQIARGYNATAVLKGRFTLIASPKGPIHWNPTGDRSLATGGTGDVLSGIIGGLLAQGLPTDQAAIAGVYLHGAAGEAAGRMNGPDGVLAGDLLPLLPQVLRGIKEDIREP